MELNKRARVAAIVLASTGILLWTLAVAGQHFHGYYRLRPWLHHPLVFLIAGLLLLALAWGLGVRRSVLKWVGFGAFTLLGAALAALAWFISVFDQKLTELSRTPAPDRTMDLVVYEGYNFIDPFWKLRVQTKNGILSRETDLGCVNGDIVTVNMIDWTGERTVRVRLSNGETVDIRVDAAGRPDRTVDGGC